MEIPMCDKIQPKYWGCLTIEYAPVVSNFFGVQWVSATSNVIALTPQMAIQTPSTISGKEIIKWRREVETLKIGMIEYENSGRINLGCGEIQSPRRNTNSIVSETVP